MKRSLLLLSVIYAAGLQAQQPVSTPKFPGLKPREADKLWMMDIYTAAPTSLSGIGMGMGLFSPVLNPSEYPLFRLRCGLDLYGTGLAHSSYVEHVPLSGADAGEAKVRVKNSVFGLNAVARLAFGNHPVFTPYIDLFAGGRFFTSSLEIRPYHVSDGQEDVTYQSLSNTQHLNAGFTGGMLFSLSPRVMINAGLMYTTSNRKGLIENTEKISLQAANVITEKTNSPKNLFVLKLGLTFIISSSKDNVEREHCNSDYGTTTTGTTPVITPSRSNHVNVSSRTGT